MKTFFDAARFARLWRAHFAENKRDYLWFVVVAAILDLLFMAIFFSTHSNALYIEFQFGGQLGWYSIGLFILGIIFAGRFFKQLADPGAALITLMRPASHVEKCLLTFVVVSVLFPLAYTLCFLALNFPAVQLAKSLYSAPENYNAAPNFNMFIPFLNSGMPISGNGNFQPFFKIQFFVLMVLWSAQALVLGGTVYFKRSPLLRTLLTIFLMFVLLSWLAKSPHMGTFWSSTRNELLPFNMMASILSLVEWLGMPVLLWIVVFFHLKEREVS